MVSQYHPYVAFTVYTLGWHVQAISIQGVEKK